MCWAVRDERTSNHAARPGDQRTPHRERLPGRCQDAAGLRRGRRRCPRETGRLQHRGQATGASALLCRQQPSVGAVGGPRAAPLRVSLRQCQRPHPRVSVGARARPGAPSRHPGRRCLHLLGDAQVLLRAGRATPGGFLDRRSHRRRSGPVRGGAPQARVHPRSSAVAGVCAALWLQHRHSTALGRAVLRHRRRRRGQRLRRHLYLRPAIRVAGIHCPPTHLRATR